MKLTARIFILLISIVAVFLSLTPQKILAAGATNPFDFNLEKYIDTKINNRDPTVLKKGVNVNVGETEGYRIPAILTESANMLIVLDPKWNPQQTRAVPALVQIMGKMYEYPPASAMAYTYDLLHNAGLLTQPVYAQGIGFAGLSPLLPLWKATRNISYAILIIVMVAIGFMIIFRMKIDPKTVISVQAALPKIILTLILITFSYPIAGFMIDLMYLMIMIVIEILSKAVPADLPWGADFMRNTAGQQQAFVQSGFLGWVHLFTSVFSVGLLPAFFQQFFGGSGVNTAIGTILAGAITKVIGSIGFLSIIPATGVGVPAVIFGIVAIPVIILVLIGLGLLFTFIRLTFLLLNSYIQLLLAVILGPLLLLKEAIPGQSAFGDWMKNLLANLVVFPATVAVIYFSWIMTAVTMSGNLWGAPLIPVGGGGDLGKGNPLSAFIGLGIIFMSPNLVASIKKAFGAKPAVPVTAGSAFAPLTGAAQTGMGAMSQYYYAKQTFGEGKALGNFLGKIFPGKK